MGDKKNWYNGLIPKHILPISLELCGGTVPMADGLELYSDCRCSSPAACVVSAHLPKALYQWREDYSPLTEKGIKDAIYLQFSASNFPCRLKTKPTNQHPLHTQENTGREHKRRWKWSEQEPSGRKIQLCIQGTQPFLCVHCYSFIAWHAML